MKATFHRRTGVLSYSCLKQASRRELIQMDFEAILKYFRVSMPKKYLDEDEYKKLITSALSFRVRIFAP